MFCEIYSPSGAFIPNAVKRLLTLTETINKTMDEVELSPSWKSFLFQPKHKNIHTNGIKCFYDVESEVLVVELADLEHAVEKYADPDGGLVITKSCYPDLAYKLTIYDDYLE